VVAEELLLGCCSHEVNLSAAGGPERWSERRVMLEGARAAHCRQTSGRIVIWHCWSSCWKAWRRKASCKSCGRLLSVSVKT
jgi:hypothetical protein